MSCTLLILIIINYYYLRRCINEYNLHFVFLRRRYETTAVLIFSKIQVRIAESVRLIQFNLTSSVVNVIRTDLNFVLQIYWKLYFVLIENDCNSDTVEGQKRYVSSIISRVISFFKVIVNEVIFHCNKL